MERIGAKLVGYIDGLSKEQAIELVRGQWIHLRLQDADGNWTSSTLQERGAKAGLSSQEDPRPEMKQLVADVARSALQNGYLTVFLSRIADEAFPHLMERVEQEGGEVLPKALAWGLVLQRLTTAMREDWRILGACHEVWEKKRVEAKIGQHMTLFDFAKLHSVENAVLRSLGYHETRRLPANFASVLLPLNILEACAEDIRLGNFANAQAGWALAWQRPGTGVDDAATHAGPTLWSDDGKGVRVRMPLPKQWADLYGMWNLAFVSHYGEFALLMAKLLIPAVADYDEKPDEYIHHRALALYASLHHLYFDRSDHAKSGQDSLHWADGKLTQLWGNVSRDCAQDYRNQLKRAVSEARAAAGR